MPCTKVRRPVKGYKVFKLKKGKLDCRGYKFGSKELAANTKHTQVGQPILCSTGFHFCKKLQDCFRYYSGVTKALRGHVVCEVEGRDFVTTDSGDKVATNHLVIKKVLTEKEVLDIMTKFASKGAKKAGVEKKKVYNVIIVKHYDFWSNRNKYFVEIPGHGRQLVSKEYAYKANLGLEVAVEVTTTITHGKLPTYYSNSMRVYSTSKTTYKFL